MRLDKMISLSDSSACCDTTEPWLVGDPVDTLTGAVFDRKLEFRLTGPLELWWWRQYDSSQSHRRYALGWGHTHDFDRSLRFDIDGISYEGPLGRVFGFPPLTDDGDECAHDGFILRRLSLRQYELFHHGEPSMGFEFENLNEPARLKRFFQGPNQILFLYGTTRRLERIIDSAGRHISVVEEKDGRLISLTLENGEGKPGILLVAYTYDEQGNLVGTANGSGHGYAFSYDDANRLIRRTGRKGFSFYFAYDAQGRCISAKGDDNIYGVALKYDIPGRVTKVTREDGGEWTYFFDEAGGLLQILDPLGGVQQFVRDKSGHLTAEVDPNGNATHIAYDASGSPIAKITPLGYRIPLPEDPNAPDPLMHRVAENPAEYEYGRLLIADQITLPDEVQEGALPLSSEARPMVFFWPKEGKPSDSKRKFNVSPLGVRWWPKPENGWIFNDLGKLVQQQDEFGRLRHWTYDASGNIAQHTDFDGRKWSYDYGSWHFLRGLSNPLKSEVRYSYTPEGEVASFIDAGGTLSEYRYDLKNQLVEVRRHGVVRETYTRDAAGNLIGKHAGDGWELLNLEIGPGNLPVKRILASGGEHTIQYDEAGRPVLAATKKDSVELAYDALGNRCVEKRNGQGVEHHFQGWRVPAESLFFSRFTVRYERSTDGMLVIIDPGGKYHEIRFHHPHGLLERRFSNGSRETCQYDNLGRCLFKHARLAGRKSLSRRYHWSGEGELDRVDDSSLGVIRHEYDAAHRLLRRIVAGRVEDYGMDLADNLVRQPGLDGATLQEGNRLKSANGFDFTYNDRNHVEMRQTPNGPVRYTYDSRDQLIWVETPKGTWEAEYDEMGRRTRKTWVGQTTEYYWNTDQLMAEVHHDGRLRLYIYADPLALTPIFFLDYDSVDAPADSCRRYFIYADQIGTPCFIEDEKGTVVWRAHISPFGQAEVDQGAKIEFNLRFPGHYFDPELGLHYNRFRYYDPALGRYIQSDPWGIAGGFNLYAYRSNPLLQVDVRGLGEEGNPACKQKKDEEGTKVPGPKTEGKYDQLGLTMTSLGREVDRKYPVRIFTLQEREKYRVVAGPNGELVYPNQGNRPVHAPGGEAIYIMNKSGNVYVHEEPKFGDIHHSSLAAGEEPIAAGHVAQIGEPPGPAPPHMMNNGSGHYHPSNDRTELAKQELASQGVDTSGTRTESVGEGQVMRGGQQLPPDGAPQGGPVDTEGPTSPQTPKALGR